MMTDRRRHDEEPTIFGTADWESCDACGRPVPTGQPKTSMQASDAHEHLTVDKLYDLVSTRGTGAVDEYAFCDVCRDDVMTALAVYAVVVDVHRRIGHANA